MAKTSQINKSSREKYKKQTLTFGFNLKISVLSSVGMTGFEPATTRPPDVYSNRAELHPEGNWTLVVLSSERET